MSVQIPAQVISVWRYILTHPITWAILGFAGGFIAAKIV